MLWPDSSEGQSRTNLRNLLHRLQGALPDSASCIAGDGQTIGWRAEAPLELDLAGFEQALARGDAAGRAGEAGRERQALEEATALYRGELLPSCYDEWLLPIRERLA